MFRFSRILVPFDGSPLAEQALSIAQAMSAELLLLRMVSVDFLLSSRELESLHAEVAAHARREAESYLQKVHEEGIHMPRLKVGAFREGVTYCMDASDKRHMIPEAMVTKIPSGRPQGSGSDLKGDQPCESANASDAPHFHVRMCGTSVISSPTSR